MPRFHVDAPKNRVIRALERLGYRIIRERNHICMARENPCRKRQANFHTAKDVKHTIIILICWLLWNSRRSKEIPDARCQFNL